MEQTFPKLASCLQSVGGPVSDKQNSKRRCVAFTNEGDQATQKASTSPGAAFNSERRRKGHHMPDHLEWALAKKRPLHVVSLIRKPLVGKNHVFIGRML